MLAATSSNHSIRLFSRQNLASTTTITGNTVMQVNRVYSESCFVNLKSSGLEVLFRIINSSNYREVDIKKKYLLSFFSYQK